MRTAATASQSALPAIPGTVRFSDTDRRGRAFRTRPSNPTNAAREEPAPFARRAARPRRSGMDARLEAGHDEAERTAPWNDEGEGKRVA